jgi:hypothetical protein
MNTGFSPEQNFWEFTETKTNFIAQQNECGIYFALVNSLKVPVRKNSVLLHDLYDRVNESQLSSLDVNPSAWLEFVLIIRIILLAVQRETAVWHQPVRSSCLLPRVSSMLYSFFLMELVARKFFMYFETGFF